MIAFLLISLAFLVAIIEIYYWEQEIKKKIIILPTIQGFNLYWLIHPLLVVIPVYIITNSLLDALGAFFLYGVLEDIFYFSVCGLLGSDTSYSNQDWMPVFTIFGFRIPQYYIYYTIIGSILFLV